MVHRHFHYTKKLRLPEVSFYPVSRSLIKQYLILYTVLNYLRSLRAPKNGALYPDKDATTTPRLEVEE